MATSSSSSKDNNIPVDNNEEPYDSDEYEEVQSTSSKSTRTPRQHPLENPWTLWFHNPSKKTNASNYLGFLNEVYTFKTVEEFWSLFNHVMAPSKLGLGCTYYLVCIY
jgi:hypothetical protein